MPNNEIPTNEISVIRPGHGGWRRTNTPPLVFRITQHTDVSAPECLAEVEWYEDEEPVCSPRHSPEPEQPDIRIINKITIEEHVCCACGKHVNKNNTTAQDRDYIFSSYYDGLGIMCCKKCYEQKVWECVVCGHRNNRDLILPKTRGGVDCCSNCYCQAVWPYHFKPKPIFYGKGDLHYGIEVEVEIDPDEDVYDVVPMFDQDYLYYKSDSSIDYGVEIVSHPATFEELVHGKCNTIWGNVFNKRCITSLTHDTCGMHVHLSLKAFTSLHLYKFMKFIYESPNFILGISQRKVRSLKQWAGLDNPNDRSIIYKAKYKSGYERHVAVALTESTVEVRIFRGVTTLSEFTKNVEFLEALYQFTNTASVKHVNVERFVKYVLTNRNQYPTLNGFIHNLSDRYLVETKPVQRISRKDRECVL